MAPPCFADLGKQTRDLFSKNYNIGLVKLECKTKTSTGVHFTVNGTSSNDTGKINAFIETKYPVKDYGVTIKEKWNTNNILATELCVEDQFAKGLKISAESNFAPTSGKKSAVVKGAFKNEHMHLNTDVNVDDAGPVIHGAGVFHYQGWLTGAQVSFDAGKSKLTRTNFGLGYSQNDFVFHTNVIDGQEFGGYVYQKVNDKLQSGMQLNWTAGTNTTNFALGCIYSLDEDSSLRAKVNNQSQIGLSFTHRLRKGIFLVYSGNKDWTCNHPWLDGTQSIGLCITNPSYFGVKHRSVRLELLRNVVYLLPNSILSAPSDAPKPYGSGIQLTLSALIDGKSINEGGHKIGMGLELEG